MQTKLGINAIVRKSKFLHLRTWINRDLQKIEHKPRAKEENTNKGPPGGKGWGGVVRFFYPKSYFFCDLKPHAKFRNPTITPSGSKVTTSEREKEKKRR